MKQKLFQFTVLHHAYTNVDGKKEYQSSAILLQPQYTLAASEKEVLFKATRMIDEKDAADPDNIEILIRNF